MVQKHIEHHCKGLRISTDISLRNFGYILSGPGLMLILSYFSQIRYDWDFLILGSEAVSEDIIIKPRQCYQFLVNF